MQAPERTTEKGLKYRLGAFDPGEGIGVHLHLVVSGDPLLVGREGQHVVIDMETALWLQAVALPAVLSAVRGESVA